MEIEVNGGEDRCLGCGDKQRMLFNSRCVDCSLKETAKHPHGLKLAFKRIFPTTGDRLWAFRVALGMTQQALADDVGISAGTISHLECGYTLGQGRTLIKIARTLNLSIDYLLDLSDRRELSKLQTRKRA